MSASDHLPEEGDTDLPRLLTVLLQLEGRLRAEGQEFWADWLGSSRTRIDAGDAQGLKHLQRAFGGMGSINDLGLQEEDRALLSEVYRLINSLGQQLEREDKAFRWT